MATNVNVGGFHHFYSVLLGVLSSYAVAQSALSDDLGFNVYSDYMRTLEPKDLPAVVIFPPSFRPEEANSAHKKHMAYVIDFEIELITKGFETTVEDLTADEKAVERLLILTQQVIDAVWALHQVDFGMEPGEIFKKTFPSFSPYVSAQQLGESIVVGGKIEFSLGIAWEPSEPSRAPLELITINGLLINPTYQFEEQT